MANYQPGRSDGHPIGNMNWVDGGRMRANEANLQFLPDLHLNRVGGGERFAVNRKKIGKRAFHGHGGIS